MKIDFGKIEVFNDIGRSRCAVMDIRRDFANVLYMYGSGIEAHALALKIYNSKGEEEYDRRERELIRKASRLCSPAFIDAIGSVLDGGAALSNDKNSALENGDYDNT